MSDATHHCEDCDTDLEVLWDDRDSEDTPIVCGECGGTNTRRLVADGGEEVGRATPREKLQEASKSHRHDDTDIITVPKGYALLCHTCKRPVAEERGVSNRGA